MKPRFCLQCSRPLPSHRRLDARYCPDGGCRTKHWRRRRRVARALTQRRKCQNCRKVIPLSKRADARYHSTACRLSAYRKRKRIAGSPTPAKAHQRIVCERLAAADEQTDTPDIAAAQVREIPLAQAKALIELYEWLGTMPAVSRYAFGLFFGDRCGGAVVYGDEYGENLGVWDRYGYTGNIIALLRGARVHWAPANSASKLTRDSMRLLPEKFKIVTATVDAAAGEIGIVYQAAGFDYVGTMSAGGRTLIRVNGKHMSERQAQRLAGTRGARALAGLGFDAIPVPRRARYFAFRGGKREQAHYRAAIAELIKSYPKRL